MRVVRGAFGATPQRASRIYEYLYLSVLRVPVLQIPPRRRGEATTITTLRVSTTRSSRSTTEQNNRCWLTLILRRPSRSSPPPCQRCLRKSCRKPLGHHPLIRVLYYCERVRCVPPISSRMRSHYALKNIQYTCRAGAGGGYTYWAVGKVVGKHIYYCRIEQSLALPTCEANLNKEDETI